MYSQVQQLPVLHGDFKLMAMAMANLTSFIILHHEGLETVHTKLNMDQVNHLGEGYPIKKHVISFCQLVGYDYN